ncbi:MAG TPA: hypothetical protein VKK79_06680 [Candidatus Lokiarchaeia archaeon]|nr:hypothetical protein [Candidatus Lokiarchaeia archaeon]
MSIIKLPRSQTRPCGAPLENVRCECEEPAILSEGGITVCVNCGTVLSTDPYFLPPASVPERKSFFSKTVAGAPVASTLPAQFPAGRFATRKYEFKRFATLTRHDKTPYQKSLAKVVTLRRRLLADLEFRDPQGISLALLKWAIAAKYAPGRYFANLVPAAVYIAAVEQGFYIVLKELAAASVADERRIRAIVRDLYSGCIPSFPPELRFERKDFDPRWHLRGLSDRLQLAPVDFREALLCLEKMGQHFRTDHAPQTKASVAIFIATNGRISFPSLSANSGISVPTLRAFHAIVTGEVNRRRYVDDGEL